MLLDVAHAVVDLGEEGACTRRDDRRRRNVPGQVGTRVAGPLYQRVPGVAVGGDGRHQHLALLVLEQVRLLHAARAVGDGVIVGGLGRGDLRRK